MIHVHAEVERNTKNVVEQESSLELNSFFVSYASQYREIS